MGATRPASGYFSAPSSLAPPLEVAFCEQGVSPYVSYRQGVSTLAHYHITILTKKSPLRHERGHNGDWSIYSAKSRKRQIQKTRRNLYMHFN